MGAPESKAARGKPFIRVGFRRNVKLSGATFYQNLIPYLWKEKTGGGYRDSKTYHPNHKLHIENNSRINH